MAVKKLTGEELLGLSASEDRKFLIERGSQPIKIIEQVITDRYAIYQGDCVEVAKGLPDNSLHFSIFSPPFSSLYSYTDSLRDMSNVRTDAEFFKGFGFLIDELFRCMMPGRIVAFHCMNLPSTKQHNGFIGIRDFRGALIRAFQERGFIYHSEVVIWKDPVTAMQRTKAIGLLHKQVTKDSCISRQAIPDYLVAMRKPGDNVEPVAGEFDRYIGADGTGPRSADTPCEICGGTGFFISDDSDDFGEKYRCGCQSVGAATRFSIEVWQRYASPVWMDINPSDTLQKESAREDEDSRHICPLQLTVIRRTVELWTNPGDVVFSPFAGIGSEGYVSVQEGRRFIGAELKDTYYRQAVQNLERAAREEPQNRLNFEPETK